MASTPTLVQGLSRTLIAHPYLAIVLVILATCTATYIRSSLRYRSRLQQCLTSNTPQPPPPLPYSVPFLGAAPNVLRGLPEYLTSLSKAHPSLSVFQIHLLGGQHNIVLAPSIAHQILTGPKIMTKINMRQLIFHNLETFWGDSKREFRRMDQDKLDDMHKVLADMMREDFMKPAVTKLQDSVGRDVYNLVSFNKSPIDQNNWEWGANTRVLPNPPPSSSQLVAETNLHRVIRDFVSQIATDVLMGPDFVANNKNVIYDLWLHDSYFNAYLLGIPSIFIPPSINKARHRLLRATADHHNALLKYLRGEDPGSSWPHIGEASQVVIDRATKASEAGMSEMGIARTNATIIWGLNINANQVIFWMIFYLYSNPTLLEQIRKEISPYVKVVHPAASETALPIKPAPEVKFDLPGLRRKCPLLQGLFIEAMRLEAASLSYKYVNETFTATESAEDAKIFGREKNPLTYIFQQGEYVCIPHGVHQADPRYFENPDVFEGDRFLVDNNTNKKPNKLDEQDQEEAFPSDPEKEGTKTTTYKTMHPWGGGKEICKGKKFAEDEVLIFTAAIATVWDITPVDAMGKATKWKHPGRMPSAGTTKPKEDIRVRVQRRV